MTENNNPGRYPPTPLRRLLGPRGPELSCEECFELLDEYVDLEVAHAAADQAIPGMRAHLEGCSACSEEHDSLLALVESDSARKVPEPERRSDD